VTSYAIRGARLRGLDGTWRVGVEEGVVSTVRPDVPDPEHSDDGVGEVVDVGGSLVLPGFVDLHVHLDKAYQLDRLDGLGEDYSGLEGALRATARVRQLVTTADLERGAQRVLDTMAAGGTVAARAHVEVSPSSDPAAVGLHLDLAATNPDLLLELTAFAQHGTTADPSVLRRMERALADGCSVVGGCPYADPDPLGHLDRMIALAVDAGVPLDLHLDLSDDAGDILLDQVVPRVEAAGLQGEVVVGHVTALTAAPPGRVSEIAAAVAGAGITVVSIPTTDLYLSGRGTTQAPTRGVTRIAELLEHDVPVALGSNNYENAFTPVTLPSLSHAAWLASLTNYLATSAQQLRLLDAITSVPAAATRMRVPSLDVGAPVGAVAFAVEEAVDVVRAAARPTWRVTARGPVRLDAPTAPFATRRRR
jgi:cytosine/creatinine deaminase